MRLARIIYPQDKILELELKLYDATTALELRRNALDPALLAKYPGIVEAIIGAGRSVVQKHLIARAPGRQQQFATFYETHFSPDEIDQLTAFYSSPTGQKLIDRLYTRTDVQQLISTVPGKLENGLTDKQAEDLRHRAAAQAYEQFTADDKKTLAAFIATPLYAKLGRVKAEFDALLRSTDSDPTLDADMDAAIDAAANAYVSSHGTH